MSKWRDRKFDFINRFLAPIGITVLRLWVGSWRHETTMTAEVERVCRGERLIAAALHGSMFCLPILSRYTHKLGRVACALTSPSRDGKLQVRVLKTFGIESVEGSSRSKAVAGSLGLLEAVKSGRIGFIIVDGPRGPAGIPKEGIARLARAAQAQVICVSVGCRHAIRFGTWDGLYLPLPFSTIKYQLTVLDVPPDSDGGAEKLLREVEEVLRRETIALGSPMSYKLIKEPAP